MKDLKKTEVKRALMGRTYLAEDGRLAVIPPGTFMPTPVGIADGASAVRFLGVTRRVRRYETRDREAKVREAALKSMQNIGRGLALAEQPEAIACLIRYILTRPAVLVFTYEDGVPTLTAWTGRGLTGWISLRRAIRDFEKGLPDTMQPIDVKPSKEKPPKEKKGESRKGETPPKEEQPSQEEKPPQEEQPSREPSPGKERRSKRKGKKGKAPRGEPSPGEPGENDPDLTALGQEEEQNAEHETDQS